VDLAFVNMEFVTVHDGYKNNDKAKLHIALKLHKFIETA